MCRIAWPVDVYKRQGTWRGTIGAYGGLIFGLPYRTVYPVSYTHLDVYKRQTLDMALFAIMAAMAKTKKMASLLRSAAPAVAGAVLFAAQPAEAKILEGYVDVYVGGMYGTPPKLNSVVTIKSEPNGTTKGADFFDYNSGGLLGLRGGVEVLHTDVYVQFDQFVNLQGFSGSTVQGMIGWDFELGSGTWRGTIGACLLYTSRCV